MPVITHLGLVGMVAAVTGMVGVSLTDPLPPPPTRLFGSDRMLAVDMHVHAFPGDGALLPWDWAREAARRRLDAIAITNHNQMFGIDATSWRATPFGVLLIPGEEVTMALVHITAIGVKRPVSWHGDIASVATAIHAQGGVAIAAHPTENQRSAWTKVGFRAVDGVEVAHPTMYRSRGDRADLDSAYRLALQAHPGIAAIGSSDDHTAEPLGLCRTYVFAPAATPDAIVEAIRRGRTVACDADGVATGPPALAAAAAEACRIDAAAGQGVPRQSELATGLAWLGLVVLAFFGCP